MKKFIVSMVVGTILTTSLVASAGTWSEWGTITRIADYGQGLRIQGVDISNANPAACSSTKWAHVNNTSNRTAAEVERANKMLMTAFLTGRQVRVKVDDDVCVENYPAIYAVEIK